MASAEDPEPQLGAAGAFAADAEVGRDLVVVDWGVTPLGQPGSWPQSLQTAVDILLSSRFSMWMAWGPELTFFCNAAYRPTLGRKYPWALGRPASEVWEEIWDDIGPRIDTVLATGNATWDEALLLFLERSGYPEETYHTFSYSPLRDESRAAAGPQPARPALHLDLPVRQRRSRRPAGRVHRCRRRSPGRPGRHLGRRPDSPAERPEPAPGTRGHGLIFMHALTDDVIIDPSAHGTTVTLTKELKP